MKKDFFENKTKPKFKIGDRVKAEDKKVSCLGIITGVAYDGEAKGDEWLYTVQSGAKTYDWYFFSETEITPYDGIIPWLDEEEENK